MNLRRQLLLLSLLTLVLPWAGLQFIKQSEVALRQTQQDSLAANARAIAGSLARFRDAFPEPETARAGDRLYGAALVSAPTIDGYFDDWPLSPAALTTLRGVEGPIQYALGVRGQYLYLFLDVADRSPAYADVAALSADRDPILADYIELVSAIPAGRIDYFIFAAEAPGRIASYLRTTAGHEVEQTFDAVWRDVPGGYRLEARIPRSRLGSNLGIVVHNAHDGAAVPTASRSFAAAVPGSLARGNSALTAAAGNLLPAGMRLIVTDADGWRLANVGTFRGDAAPRATSGWLRALYRFVIREGAEAVLAEPNPHGRERQQYIRAALAGRPGSSWFRGADDGNAVVAVAQPVLSGDQVIGAVVLQQGTDAILSLTNQSLARLISGTLLATLLVALGLLGYASWLSRRISRLSVAAEEAVDNDNLHASLPSAAASDEIGDLSRSFAGVLGRLGEYNDYLRTLASKLSHELRTPLAIVTSSLENLEHENKSEAAAGYAARAKDGAERLRRILTAMSEASRVEELMRNADRESFDLREVLDPVVSAYRDAWPDYRFRFDTELESAPLHAAPELLIQMLDKLVDNAVGFSPSGDEICIGLRRDGQHYLLEVTNTGPPLPDRMRARLFDSMVSIRGQGDQRHLGLGLYVARIIAEGHGGHIAAENVPGGVTFSVRLPGG